MATHYEFRFFGQISSDKKIYTTDLLKGTITLQDTLKKVPFYLEKLEFQAVYGHIRELTKENGNEINEPAEFDTGKKQAFIIQREPNEISNEEDTFFVKGRKIEFSFKKYDVNILKI